MNSESVLDVLQRAEPFAGVSAQSLSVLAARARRMRAVSGQYIVTAGENGSNLYLILHGSVRLAFPNIAGNEKTVATLDAMKVFGLAEIFSGQPYRYHVESVSDVELISIPVATLRHAGDRDARVYRNLLAYLSRHFDALAHDIEYSTRFSAFQRVVNFLLGTAREQADGSVRSRLPNTKSHTASRLGLTPETFSRSLATLSEAKLIRVDRRNIDLLDVEGLQVLLDDPGPT